MGKNPPADAGDAGSSPSLGRPPGRGNGYAFQYSCLRNPVDREPSGYSHGVTRESDTTQRLKNGNKCFKYSSVWLHVSYLALFYI